MRAASLDFQSTHLYHLRVFLRKRLEKKVLIFVRVHFIVLGTLFVEAHYLDCIRTWIKRQLLQPEKGVSDEKQQSSRQGLQICTYWWPIVRKCLIVFTLSFLSAVIFGITLVARPLEP
jgi:hypothetical protein